MNDSGSTPAPASADAVLDITHDADRSRFTTTVAGALAQVEYEMHGGTMVITHTDVPDAIGGRGIAGQLTRVALDHARAAGWKVRPECSYAADWLRRHPEYAELVA